MRDLNDNVVIICSIENIDPMGIHTGDSVTVAPAQTLSDKCYQYMRDASIAVMREIGVETGGSNVQWAVNPKDGRMVIIEMNPRVSRSSALASKATGFPIAKFAAKLAVGYTLDEISNDITKKTPASFEPSIDYCVVKYPRFTFEKFPGTPDQLTTQMRSVGETMAIGRTFKESFGKAMRSLEIGRGGYGSDGKDKLRKTDVGWEWHESDTEMIDNTSEIKRRVCAKLRQPNSTRFFYIRYAWQLGIDCEEICNLTGMDPWFIDNFAQIFELEEELKSAAPEFSAELLRKAKQFGFSDKQLAFISGNTEYDIRKLREKLNVKPVYKLVDTCAAEFEAFTPYYYSSYENGENEAVRSDFEPLTFEDVMAIYEQEKCDGVIVQLGGQTPLNLAVSLEKAGVPIIGTSPESIDRAENRELFQQMLHKLNLQQPPNGIVFDADAAVKVASQIGYPVLVRPSYVLGGRAMQIVYSDDELHTYITESVQITPDRPVLIDKFIEDAVEVDVDCIADGEIVVIGGIMEHIEKAGVHSGDSACVIPPHTLSDKILDEIRTATKKMAKELNVCGLMNVQYAIRGDQVYILEVNPRASRTVPFVSKSIGIPLAKIAARVMAGKKLKELGFTEEKIISYFSVKEAVMPFVRFPGCDIELGPEMRSTGEVMGIDSDFGIAFAKTQFGIVYRLNRFIKLLKGGQTLLTQLRTARLLWF